MKYLQQIPPSDLLLSKRELAQLPPNAGGTRLPALEKPHKKGPEAGGGGADGLEMNRVSLATPSRIHLSEPMSSPAGRKSDKWSPEGGAR